MSEETAPKFRIQRGPPPRVILLCTKCDADIREFFKWETMRVDRAYFCKDCDEGAIVLNMPTENKDEDQE